VPGYPERPVMRNDKSLHHVRFLHRAAPELHSSYASLSTELSSRRDNDVAVRRTCLTLRATVSASSPRGVVT